MDISKNVGHNWAVDTMQYPCIPVHKHGLQFPGSAGLGMHSACQLCQELQFCIVKLYKIFLYQPLQV